MSHIQHIKYNCMRIYLIGYMGSGKSSFGRRLARKLDYDFFDIDLELEAKSGLRVSEIFEIHGEQKFREMEREMLHHTASLDRVVIATGGGTPCHFDNMDFILKNGISVYLRLDVPSLVYRLERSSKVRPLIANLNGEELAKDISTRLAEREQWYLKANCIVKGESLKTNNVISLIFGEQPNSA